jgi:hypothetical protein
MIDEEVARVNAAYRKVIRSIYEFNVSMNKAISHLGKDIFIQFAIEPFDIYRWTNWWLMVLSQTDTRLTEGFLWAVGDTR